MAINEDGWRDRPHTKEKPDGTFRIAVLGDSYTEARQVAQEEVFSSVLERAAQECSSQTVEVMNFGVSGFGTAQELLLLRNRVWAYHPDIILLAFLTGNDIRNNSFALEKNTQKPYFSYASDGSLIPDFSFRETLFFRRQSSRPFRMLHWIIVHARSAQLLLRVRNWMRQNTVQDGGTGERGLDDAIYAAPVDVRWQEAWSMTEDLLSTMHREVQAHGAGFFVAVLSNSIQVRPDPRMRERTAERLGVPDLLYPDRRIAALGRREGFPVLTLAEPLQRYAEHQHIFLHGFSNTREGEGHWNAVGHKRAGEIMAGALCRARMLP